MPSYGALNALHLLIIDGTIVYDVSCANWNESVDSGSRRLILDCVDGDQTHHDASSAAIVEYFIFPLGSGCEEGDVEDWLG